jgi:hypothetical protein
MLTTVVIIYAIPEAIWTTAMYWINTDVLLRIYKRATTSHFHLSNEIDSGTHKLKSEVKYHKGSEMVEPIETRRS